MDAYNVLARRVMAPTLDLIRGCHCISCLAELEASQWWPLERIEALQTKRLARTIEHAYAHVAYYRQVMQERDILPQEIRTPLDLSRLPVLTKAIVRVNTKELIADDVTRGALLRSQTAGSTGSPLVFFSTRRDRYSYGYARGLLATEWAGLALGDKIATLVQHHVSPPTPLERRIRPLIVMLRRNTHVPLASQSDENLDAAVRLLHRTRPRALSGYPSTLALVARHIRDSGRPAPALHAILTGGEQMSAQQRALIREVFGVEPYSGYGTSENYLLATECEAHAGLHVFAQDLVVEIVDDSGSPVRPGNEGRVLVTNLHARGMPFIRYDTGDMGSYAVAPCPCGRGMPLLDLLSARRCDTIYTRSGARITGNGIERDAFALLGVTELQYVQEDLDHFIARFVAPGLSTSEAQSGFRLQATDILRHSLGPDIDITVELVDRIEPSPAGKRVPVISKVDPDSWLKETPPRP
jgi:phenylacetate-CoA ligase